MGRSFPAYLERMLNRTSGNGRSYSVVNLAWSNEGAHSFIFTLRDYAYLNYDAVIFYTGYNDLNKWENRNVFRRRSPIFRLTGYLPLLPGMMLDKAKILRQGLGINEINLGKKGQTSRRASSAKRRLPPWKSEGESPCRLRANSGD